MTPFNKAFDIGQTTYISIKKFLNEDKYDILEGQSDIKSNGNGSLMRILPVSLYCFFNNISNSFQIIKNVSCLTHSHPISIIGCYLYTKIIEDILNNKTKEEISKFKSFYSTDFTEYNEWLKDYDTIKRRIYLYFIKTH